jgi:hypothetical protein
VQIQFNQSTGQTVVDIPLLMLNEQIPAHTFTFTPPPDAKVLTTGPLPFIQAQQEAGYHLLTIPDTQKGYTFEQVSAIGHSKDISYNLYYKTGSTNVIISERKTSLSPASSGAPVTVRGQSGSVITNSGITVLTWAEDGVQISIEGTLSKDQAISMAQVLS